VIKGRDGEIKTTIAERLSELTRHFEDIHQRPSPPIPELEEAPWEQFERNNNDPNQQNLTFEINREGFQRAMAEMGPHKAPGADGITVGMIMLLPASVQDMIVRLLAKCNEYNVILDSWKQIRMVVLHKSGDKILLDN
jgi:hypothetical protein